MNPTQIILRALGGRTRRSGRVAIYFTMATTTFRVVRRLMSPRQRTLLQFEVKPGEVFEIRGIRRGR
jgi:hypothetical protein